MDLFHFQEEGPGTVFWHANGWTIFQEIVAYMRRRLKGDYQEVNAPQLLDKSLWETSGHWGWFRENMFQATSAGEETEDERIFAIKPMNCPGHIQIFKHGLKSYRDLPLRLAEFGAVHRYEPSGALHGLLRVRGFTQDDAHVFCTEDQMADECLKINDLILSTYTDFGFTGDLTVKLSTRPEKRVGSDEAWDHAENIMHDVLKRIEVQGHNQRIKTAINPGEGAFYGPKFEYVLRDAIGRDWHCGTTQVDFNLPERFEAFYIAADGSKKTPVMIHRAICGSMERFLGVLLEHYAGHLPLWLSPKQAVIATITSDADDYAHEVTIAARKLGLRVDSDLRNEKINYKVREHSLAKVPVLLVVGKKEGADRTVSIRRLGKESQEVIPLDAALKSLAEEATPPDLRRMKKGSPTLPQIARSAPSGRPRQRQRIGAARRMIEHAQETLSPMAEIIAYQHFEGGCMALTALFERHRQRAIDCIADTFRIVGIDQQGGCAFVRGACKTREDEYARIVRILRGDKFLCDEVHAVAQRRDQAGAGGAIKTRKRRTAMRLVDVAHRRP